jgi:four helix bundle protein
MADPLTGCRNLEIYKLAHSLISPIHAMTLRLPHFEMFEEGAQIRKSSTSASALIVEGYRLRKHRDQFLHYLHRALGSADETREHLDILHETGSLRGDGSQYQHFRSENDKLVAKLSEDPGRGGGAGSGGRLGVGSGQVGSARVGSGLIGSGRLGVLYLRTSAHQHCSTSGRVGPGR